MKELNLGNVWLPRELIEMVNNHREFMLEQNKDNDCYDLLENASFSLFFSDFLSKNYCKMEDEDLDD